MPRRGGATDETGGRATTTNSDVGARVDRTPNNTWFAIGCIVLFGIIVAVLLIALLGSAPPPSPSFSPPAVLPSR